MLEKMSFAPDKKPPVTPKEEVIEEVNEDLSNSYNRIPSPNIYVPIERKKTRVSSKRKAEEEEHLESVREQLTEMSWRQASDEQIMVRDRVKNGLEADGNKVNYIGAIIDDRGKRYMHVGIDGKKGLTRVALDKDDNVISLTEI